MKDAFKKVNALKSFWQFLTFWPSAVWGDQSKSAVVNKRLDRGVL